MDLDGVQLQNRFLNNLNSMDHAALIRMASSVVCLGDNGVTRMDYLRFFNEYLRGLGLPEAGDRQLKKRLWSQIVPEVLQRAEAERERTKERAGIAEIRDLKNEVNDPGTETHTI